MIGQFVLTALLIAQFSIAFDRAGPVQKLDSQAPPAPAFTLKDLRGRTVRLGDSRGKVVLINFWATWCAPCQAEMPELVKWQKEYRARGLQIIGVTYPPERRGSVRRVARRLKLNYPVLFGTSATAEAYEVGDVLPVTVIVDREGKIRWRVLGILESEEFKEKVVPLLKSAIGANPEF